eukprot:13320786-Alexandrium_andersonii.AAC.1
MVAREIRGARAVRAQAMPSALFKCCVQDAGRHFPAHPARCLRPVEAEVRLDFILSTLLLLLPPLLPRGLA